MANKRLHTSSLRSQCKVQRYGPAPPAPQLCKTLMEANRQTSPGEPAPPQGQISVCTACLVQPQESPSHTLNPSISRAIPPSAWRLSVLSAPSSRNGEGVVSQLQVGVQGQCPATLPLGTKCLPFPAVRYARLTLTTHSCKSQHDRWSHLLPGAEIRWERVRMPRCPWFSTEGSHA
jgi:hypothetical protein